MASKLGWRMSSVFNRKSISEVFPFLFSSSSSLAHCESRPPWIFQATFQSLMDAYLQSDKFWRVGPVLWDSHGRFEGCLLRGGGWSAGSWLYSDRVISCDFIVTKLMLGGSQMQGIVPL